MHFLSAGQERQLVASPARAGFRDGLKYFKDPIDPTYFGKCGGSLESVEEKHSSQRIKSMSWQDLVSNEGAVFDSLRQLPLVPVSDLPISRTLAY